mgnify:CR=1 FL=1
MNRNKIYKLAKEVLRNNKDAAYVQMRICTWLTDAAPMEDCLRLLANGEPKYPYDDRVKGWGRCYYFLYEYEVGFSAAGTQPIPWAEDRERKRETIEHILPQNHRDGGWWQAHWTDEAEADRFKHRLGNLVLTQGNAILDRKPIDQKIEDPHARYYYKHQNATITERRIASFTSGSEWLPKNILEREMEMLNFAVERWGIPCCSDNGNYPLPEDFERIVPDSEGLLLIWYANKQVQLIVEWPMGVVVDAKLCDGRKKSPITMQMAFHQ